MHLLIIPGEELNGENIYSSTFEISQGKAVREYFEKVGFISIRITHSILSPLKKKLTHFFKRGQSNTSLKNKYVEFEIDGMFGIEGTGLFKYQYLKHAYKDYIQLGEKVFKKYISKHGMPDIIHCHGRFLTGGLIGWSIHKKYNIPFVYTEHSTIYQRGMATQKDYAFLTKIINQAIYWITVSPSLGDTVKQKINVNKDYTVVPNVLDSLFEQEQTPIQKSDNKFTFLCIAAFHHKKGNEILIRAFQKKFQGSSGYRLLLGGDGPDKKYIQDLVAELNLTDQIEFLGYLNREQVLLQMQLCDTFVLPSLHETFGVVVIESMACGTPVIATKCGGPETIVNQQNGILVAVNDIDALANAMEWMYNNRNKFNDSAIKKECIERFGSKAVGMQLMELYRKAMSA